MTTRDINNKIVVSTSATGASPLIRAGLTKADTVICEDIEGWNESSNIQHDIRQGTFPTASQAGVHVGATYTPKSELALRLVFSNTNDGLAKIDAMNKRNINDVLNLVVVDSSAAAIAGYRVWYAGFSVDQFFNEGCRVTFKFTSNQALPTTY